MIERALAGAFVAAAIALAARRIRSLSTSGALAAVAVGAAAAAGGWDWAAILIAFFIVSSALSRYRRAYKESRVGAIVEKGGERDAVQVLANGGVFAVAAIAFAVTGAPLWGAIGFGALAGATADTWATEIGTLAGRRPRSVLSFKPLAPGTSGGVTIPGTLASVAGASFIAALMAAAGWTSSVATAVLVGGIVGSLADSVLGATIQERRWCDRCASSTERRVHPCGASTRVVGGIRGLRNDTVNVACSVVGGMFAAALAAALDAALAA